MARWALVVWNSHPLRPHRLRPAHYDPFLRPSLAWDAVAGATGYTVYRQDPGGGGFLPRTTQPAADGTTYDDTGVSADATYVYRVTATLAAAESAPSDVVAAHTLSDPAAGNEMFWDYTQSPQTADASSAQAAGGVELGLRFMTYSDGYITGLQFYKGDLNTGTHVGDLWDSARNLLATATFADESQSGWQQVDFDHPVAIPDESGFTVSYFGASGYYAADAGYFADGGAGSQGVQTPTGDMVANAGGNGVERFSATGGFPQQADASATNFWVQPVFFPASAGGTLTPPLGLTAQPVSDGTIRLGWGNVPTAATAVTVLASGGGSQFSYAVPATQNTCLATGLQAGTTYTFELVATNPAGSSDPSAPVSATTPSLPAPTGLTATAVSGAQIDLSWTDHSSGTTAFTIQRSDDGTNWTTIGPPSNPVATSFRDTGLTNARSYYYRVAATDAAGMSAFSNVASASTPYSVPTIAAAAAAAQTTVTGTTDTLSVLGAIVGGQESALSYTWSVVSGPTGATFSPNGINAAKNATAAFAAAGTYTLEATIQNGTASVTSSVQERG